MNLCTKCNRPISFFRGHNKDKLETKEEGDLKDHRLCKRCEWIQSLVPEKLKTKLEILILQHPQEPDVELGSAKLCPMILKNCTLKVGLSWPNLKKILNLNEINPKEWGVFYLGSIQKPKGSEDVIFKVEDQKCAVALDLKTPLKGLIFLDGSWSQAKSLWWRNSWLLKVNRLVLFPKYTSLYGKLRKEPRRECLSTIESIALALEHFGENPLIPDLMRKAFLELLSEMRGVWLKV